MGRVHEVLKWANRREVAREVTRRGYRVSGETLNRWVRDEQEFPAVVERIVFELFTIEPSPDAITRTEVMGLYQELLGEVRANRAVVQAAFAGADAEWLEQVMDRIGAELSPPAPRPDAESGRRHAATERPPEAAGQR